MKYIFNKTAITILFLSLSIAWGLSTKFKELSNFIYAASSTPTVQIKPVSVSSSTITVTFSSPVTDGDIADFELNNSSNQKVWQRFSSIGSTSYTLTVSDLPDGQYKLNVGLFKPNWASNYAWYSDLATLSLPNNVSDLGIVSPLSDVTPSPTVILSPSATPTIAIPTPTATPTPQTSASYTAAITAYNSWKAKYVTSVDSQTLRVVRPENNNDTVSEGIGYGMLLSVFAGDQTTFGGLWRYGQKYLDSKGLMNWNINSGGGVIGAGSATDADEDMTYALIKANQKWPGNGYDIAATRMINSIKSMEVVAGDYINPGDNWGNTVTMNPSYIAPSYYKAFAQFSGNSEWSTVANVNGSWLLRASNSNTGLLPDWLNADLSHPNIGWDQHPNDFYYDAIRTPIRLLMSYQYDGDINAKTILQKQSSFYNSIGMAKLTSGYTLTGSAFNSYLDTAFLSGFTAAGQVDPTSQYAQAMLNSLVSASPTGYFGTSLRALTLFIISNPN